MQTMPITHQPLMPPSHHHLMGMMSPQAQQLYHHFPYQYQHGITPQYDNNFVGLTQSEYGNVNSVASKNANHDNHLQQGQLWVRGMYFKNYLFLGFILFLFYLRIITRHFLFLFLFIFLC